MKKSNAPQKRITRLMPVAYAAALTVAFIGAFQRPADASHGSPQVPAALDVPDGNKAFLEAHAVGTQNYMCLPMGSGVAWTAVGPQATLFNDNDRQITTHFLSPNPLENGLPRPTWQHSRDTSSVWAKPIASSSDPAYVAPGAIPWLLLQVVGGQQGPTGGDALTEATYLHRVNTVGGIAPTSGCTLPSEVGIRAFAPYEADYIFYRARRADRDD